MEHDCGTCGICRKENFPVVQPMERMQARVTHFLREAGKVLMQAGAQAIYPFTITRTVHSDDQ